MKTSLLCSSLVCCCFRFVMFLLFLLVHLVKPIIIAATEFHATHSATQNFFLITGETTVYPFKSSFFAIRIQRNKVFQSPYRIFSGFSFVQDC